MNNTLRHALRIGRPTFGSWLQSGNTAIAEVMAKAGFDWLAIDLEHSAIDIETTFSLIQVVDLAGCAPLVRLSANDPVQAARVMDAGAWGVIVPSVRSAAEAGRAVDAVKYAPEGRRGVGLWRAHGYGPGFADYVTACREGSVVIPMVEHQEGIEHVEEILQVPGVDAVFVGPYDLSASYGVPGQLTHPRVTEAMRRVIDAARAAGKAAGIHVVHPPVSQVSDRLSEGFRLIAYGGDMLLLTPAVREAADLLRNLGTGHDGSRR